MANLNFKMGLYANLFNTTNAASATTAGTVYVTTDEKAIYVDVPTLDTKQNITGANRIRLGQIIIWNETEWAEAKPPFSTEAFYYVTGHNALLRYNGTNWTQINSTSDLEADISHIETLLSYIGSFDTAPTNPKEGDIYYKKPSTGTTSGSYYRYNSTSKAWESFSGFSNAITRIDNNTTEIATIKSDYALKTYADDAAGAVLGETTDASTAATVYGTRAYVAKAKTAILGTTTENGTTKDFDGTVKGAHDKADTNATAIANLQSKLQVADALVYQGTVTGAYDTVNKITTLTFSDTFTVTDTLKKGSTYKATNEFILDGGKSSTDKEIDIYIGDLLIATGEEDPTTGYITKNLKWDHIPSGYKADYVPTMSISGVDNNATTLQLTSAHADTNEKGDLGEIQIKGSENIQLTSTAGSGDTTVGVGLSLVWGVF